MSSLLPDAVILAEVRAAMARRKCTRTDLGAALGLGRGALQRRLSGRVPFRAAELATIARYLGVPVATFYEAGTTADAS